MNNFHKPVLLNEVISHLNIVENKKYIDATIGGGGHALEILKRGGKVLGIDQDQEAIDYLKTILPADYQEKIILVKGNFKDIKKIAKGKGFDRVAGILFDLGVSAYQLKNSRRGFTFKKEAILDMRMDRDSKMSVLDILNKESFAKLKEIFIKFGEESLAEQIALSIINQRKRKMITKTTELANLIINVYHRFKINQKIHPATRVFQALRIVVNNELEALEKGLNDAFSLLEKGGRLLVITYHSLEDRITKWKFRNEDDFDGHLKIINRKPITASYEEIRVNPSARSAKLRIFERI